VPDTPTLHQQAESRWQATHNKSTGVVDDLTIPDTRTLLHDLQVHQIELEIQNEELRQAKDALDASRAHYVDLYDLAPVGYCSVNEAGLMTQANLTLAILLGVARSALGRQPAFTRFVFREDQDQWYRLRTQLLKSGEPQSAELRLRPDLGPACIGDDTALVWVQLTAVLAQNDAGAQVLHITVSDISARKHAQAMQSEGETRWKFAIEGAGDGLWDWNMQTGQAFFSPRYKAMLGYAEADIGTSADEWTKRIHPDDMPGVMAALQPYMQGKPGTATVEFRMRRKDGLWQWTLGRGMVVERDAQGKALRMIGTNSDLTERKQAEAALLTSEARFRKLLQDVPLVAVQGYGADGTTHYWNRASEQLYGYSAAEAVGRNLLDTIIPAEMHDGVRQAMREMFATGVPIPAGELSLRCKDGARVNVFSSHVYVQVPGQAAEMFCVDVDLTERKQAEAKLQLAAGVFSHAREGITITDIDGTIVDINEAFTRITGYSREEAIGQNPRFLHSGRQDKAFYETMWQALSGQGHWSGEIWNRRKNGEVYAELITISAVRDAQGNTQQYVALFSDITTIKEHQSQLEHIAHFDALTNLPNRLLLADRLQQAMAQAQRRSQQVAVAYLDLDGFKNVNDKYGHDVGDQLLVALATAMKDALREGDTLARLGGDEFVAVLIDLDDIESCVPMLTRLLEAAAAPVTLGDCVLQGSASIGVTFFPQADDVEADQLLRQADQAMYQAKLAGKNRYHVFDAKQDSSIRGHHESLERIRLALAQHEFVLHYQPKVNMHTGQVIGAEALIRWQHPDKGLLAPATFLPVIEDHPLAVDLGEWVIDSALAQIALWRNAGLELPVSVNIGARQLQQGDFVLRLQAILAAHPKVQPSSLALEVLETSALADMTQVSQVIEDCHQMGVKFALDDFGTGYSSLTYLKRLRVAQLKIDQSFVRDMLDDPDDMAILQGVIGLAAAFKREVIAEGVESVAHATALLHLGCELAQGYGIARPMPAHQMPAWVAAWVPDVAWLA
jgi:diguanylate cyclase (GGDEF)-like protein/PAS domain S-box-containing protein